MDRRAALGEQTTAELVREAVATAKRLVREEVALARAELKDDARAELGLVEGLGVAGFCALFVVLLLLVALVFALSLVIAGWLAALLVALAVLLTGAVAAWVGWKRRASTPLSRTQRTVRETVKWAKERWA